MKIRAETGWALLVFYVWAWDWYGPETLSQGWWRGLKHPESRLVLLFVWAWVTSHLFLRKPRRILVRW
jgi:hypothetical protein